MREKHSICPRFISSIKYASLNWFSERDIWRMKQFYETYKGKEKLSPLVAESPWTNNLLIMTAFKTYEVKEFYLKACIENYYA